MKKWGIEMIYSKKFDIDQKCWACGEKTKYAISVGNKQIPCCTRCILTLLCSVVDKIYYLNIYHKGKSKVTEDELLLLKDRQAL